MLNIITVKLIAEKMERSGIVRSESTFCTRRVAIAQPGIVTAPRPIETMGLRYPSGMCMPGLLLPGGTFRVAPVSSLAEAVRMIVVVLARMCNNAGIAGSTAGAPPALPS
jgi:hypothetical protein